MNSSELGSLAGVTVRALRHYHQVGVLDEPPRGPNGYRQYDVHDLIRVLRIRRLAALGIPLEQMPALLDETGDQAIGLLDQLDQELAAQIDRLTTQRDLIARLREQKAAPDIPPELARFLTTFAAGRLSPAMARIDRDQTVLLAHLVGTDGMPHLVGYYERISDPALLPAITTVTAQFESLGPHTSDDELDRFVDEFVTTFAPIVRELNETESGVDLTGVTGLFTEYTTDVLSNTQQHALDLIGARFNDIN
ncbi:MerR family transcriptional regulator [Streptosporangium sp. NPDC001681]|uniref:MerR family transcriptional regulator n=1 Tax=Streptosporangium sp. NPDC001681 TaxID=3154395 RepID=UPI0033215AF2